MRDYGYLEHMCLGIPRKIVRGMHEFNGSPPEFVVGEKSLAVVLAR
jgi:ATP-dependent DNA helicase RecG